MALIALHSFHSFHPIITITQTIVCVYPYPTDMDTNPKKLKIKKGRGYCSGPIQLNHQSNELTTKRIGNGSSKGINMA